jgi:hypothetical protein
MYQGMPKKNGKPDPAKKEPEAVALMYAVGPSNIVRPYIIRHESFDSEDVICLMKKVIAELNLQGRKLAFLTDSKSIHTSVKVMNFCRT